ARADRLLRRYHRVTRAWKNIRILIGAIVWEEMNVLLHAGMLLLVFSLLVLIGVLILWANHIFRTWRRAVRAAAYYGHRLAVLDGHWAGRGERGRRYVDDAHPYAADLDLFGDASAFELLCTAHTRAGQDTLAAWLLHSAAIGEVRERQSAIAVLR